MIIKTQRITNDRRQPPTYHTVKLHLLKKTTAMNIKINSGKNKRDKLVKRERETNGRDERQNDNRETPQLSNIYTKNIS